MKQFIIFLFLILFASCEDFMNINKTTKRIQNLAKTKYSLEPFGNGVAAPDKIKNFILTFISKKYFSENEARKLLIDLTEDYIELINNSPDVLKYFEHIPVSELDTYFLISFMDCKGEPFTDLSAIRLGNGNIVFLKLDQNDMYEEYKRETYKEAYSKVYGIQPPERY